MKNLKILFLILIPLLVGLLMAKFSRAESILPAGINGRILLQVESHGEAWYANPADGKRYFLGRPQDAFNLMRQLGMGISNSNLNKIPLGTQTATTLADNAFVNKNLGRIFLQVESRGEAWYLNPADKKRHFLGRPTDAFYLMKKLGLGITNESLNKVPIGLATGSVTQPPTPPITSNKDIIYLAADAIRSGNTAKAVTYFTPEMKKAVEYAMGFFDASGRLALGNLLSSATLSSSSNNEKIYTTEAYFSLGGYKVKLNFRAIKQPDGSWLLANL